MRVESDRRFRLPLTPEEVWAAVADVDRFPQWWPWLRRFDGTGLVTGDRWECTVQPPLPYAVRFTVDLDEVVEGRSVRATVSGDVEGTARVELEAVDGGTDARLVSCLAPAGSVLRVVATVARPVARFGHDWVLDTGARSLCRHLAGDGAAGERRRRPA